MTKGLFNVFLYHSTNNYRNKVKKYLSVIDCPDYAIYLDTNAKNLLKRSNLRKSQEKNIFVYKDLKDIKKYKVFFKYIFKQIN